MSIDFWVPAAPRERLLQPCDFGRGEEWECRPGNRCGYCKDGEQETMVSPAPALNVANVTGCALLRLLGEAAEPSGSWGPGQIPAIRRRIVRLLSTPLAASEAFAASSGGGPGTGRARFMDFGLTVEQIQHRLRALDEVLAYAQEHDQGVAWS